MQITATATSSFRPPRRLFTQSKQTWRQQCSRRCQIADDNWSAPFFKRILHGGCGLHKIQFFHGAAGTAAPLCLSLKEIFLHFIIACVPATLRNVTTSPWFMWMSELWILQWLCWVGEYNVIMRLWLGAQTNGPLTLHGSSFNLLSMTVSIAHNHFFIVCVFPAVVVSVCKSPSLLNERTSTLIIIDHLIEATSRLLKSVAVGYFNFSTKASFAITRDLYWYSLSGFRLKVLSDLRGSARTPASHRSCNSGHCWNIYYLFITWIQWSANPSPPTLSWHYYCKNIHLHSQHSLTQ